MNTLFQSDGPVMRVMTDIMNLLILNILTLICCIPVVTAGASFASLHYVLMQMVDQKEGRIAGTFFKQFKGNLKNATLPWLVLLAAGVLLAADYRIFGNEGSTRYMRIPVFIGAAVIGMLFVWMFPLLARFENRFSATMKNTAILAAAYFPRTVLMAAITFAVVFVLTQVTRLLPLALFFGISLPSYFCTLIYKSVIDQMIERSSGGISADEEADNDTEVSGDIGTDLRSGNEIVSGDNEPGGNYGAL